MSKIAFIALKDLIGSKLITDKTLQKYSYFAVHFLLKCLMNEIEMVNFIFIHDEYSMQKIFNVLMDIENVEV